jgi:ketosteroid isomerase-like protein
MLYEAILAGDLQAIHALLDPRIEWEIVGSREVPHFGLYRGLDALSNRLSLLKKRGGCERTDKTYAKV